MDEGCYNLEFTNDIYETSTNLMSFTDIYVWMYAMDVIEGNHVWIVGDNGQILKYTREMSFVNESNTHPSLIELFQNTPNPFNSSTTISFYIHKGGNISLKIYDITGLLVKTILSEYVKRGEYNIQWSAGEIIPSGVYFYELKMNNISKTRKMLLIR